MSDYILDTDIFIPTGVPATPERVAELLASGDVPTSAVEALGEEQTPTAVQLGDACVASARPTDEVVAEFVKAGLEVEVVEVSIAEAVEVAVAEQAAEILG